MQGIDEAAWQAGAGEVDDALVDTPLLASLAAAVRRDPEAPAIADPDRVLSYRQLWNAATALAAEVAAATASGDRVGVRLSTGVAHGVAILACLAAGRVVVLLDTADPPARTAEVIAAAGVGFALGEPGPADGAVRWRAVDAPTTDGPMRPAPDAAIPPDAPAFIVATSGSSGVPKLIVHSQRSMGTLVHGTIERLHMTPADRAAFTGSASSAAAIQNLFHSLLSGGLAVLCDIRTFGLNSFLDLLEARGVTMLRIFPTLARLLAAQPRARQTFAHLRLVRMIGEPMLASDLTLLRGVLPPDADIVNSYGASETLGFDWFAPPGDYAGRTLVPSGRPRAGAAFVLVDETGLPCPPGTEGELLIRSRYNAVGEWRDGRCVPGRMILLGDGSGRAVYRTGDLAVVGPDGMLTVLGRADRQVKVNGNRIELGEIEAAMRAIPGIAAAAVVARKEPGRMVLLGFFVAGAAGIPVAALREALARRVPPAMVPAQFFRLDSLPFLPGFKLDTAALLAHAAAGSA